MRPESAQASPAARRSRLRRMRCAVTLATLPLSRATTRSPACDFGRPHTSLRPTWTSAALTVTAARDPPAWQPRSSRRADGLTYRQLAGEFGISDISAYAAVNRRTWAHVA